MPDIFVHAAAIQQQGGCLDGDPKDWADIYDVNVIGAVRCMRWCIPSMREQGRGAVLLLSSINASFATPTLAAYAASKAALENLAKTAAFEFAADGVRVNAIAPASIDTPLLRATFGDGKAGGLALARNAQRHPITRLGTVDEVAELALFLVSEKSSWITGVIHKIDGGASVTRR
jgi:NAD(P)-dependent dehydrogenase (short-subunit alcohol dehydrogenase family)